MPLLSDKNINDQGIDATGIINASANAELYEVRFNIFDPTTTESASYPHTAALRNAINALDAYTGGGTTVNITIAFDAGKTERNYATRAQVDAIATAIAAITTAGEWATGKKLEMTAVPRLGNLYGSAKDVGAITARLPALSESGGRVNRVGFTRITRQASLTRYGFFYEFTDESLDFDTDAQLKDHLARELMNGAIETYEAQLQQDLLSAGTTRVYPGSATSRATIATQLAYTDLLALDEQLTLNRTPKQTTILTGSNNVDTRTIPASRILFVGPEVASRLRNMTDGGGNFVFVGVQHYAGQTKPLNGEIGSIDSFRIVMVPDMQYWEGAGSSSVSNVRAGYSVGSTTLKANVYPMLVVGEDSFTTIGFNTGNGRGGKFNVISRMPGAESADVYNNPYGTTGFSSIQWYYGCLILRPERIGIIETAVGTN